MHTSGKILDVCVSLTTFRMRYMSNDLRLTNYHQRIVPLFYPAGKGNAVGARQLYLQRPQVEDHLTGGQGICAWVAEETARVPMDCEGSARPLCGCLGPFAIGKKSHPMSFQSFYHGGG